MNISSIKTYTANLKIGLFKGYSKELISIEVFKEVLMENQTRI